jgi:hypothetical protein
MGSTNDAPLLPPARLLVPGEMDTRCGCCWGSGSGARLPVLALVLEMGLSESRSRLADGGLG